ncbi:MAG: cupin domain-containing protein [Eubacteriales bacterium]|nr:cupin domain-containing protein [Eubacteriales bacterium]
MHGKVSDVTGMVINTDSLKLVHRPLTAGAEIAPHSHPGMEVCFFLLSGRVDVCLDGEEHHILVGPQALSFDGQHEISARAEEVSEAVVCLRKA